MATKRNSAGSPNRAPARKPPPKRSTDVKVFIAEYIKDSNGRRAAIAAGYSARSADSTASRLLRNAKVRAEVDKHQAEVIEAVKEETGITLARTLREIARVAFLDPRKLFDEKGNPLALVNIDDDTAAAIAGLDVQEVWEGSGQNRVFAGHIKKWKLADKIAGLDKLMKHLGGYKEDNGQKTLDAEKLALFIGGLHQSGAGKLPMKPRK